MGQDPKIFEDPLFPLYPWIIQGIQQAINSGNLPLTAARAFLDSLSGTVPGQTGVGLNPAEIRTASFSGRLVAAQPQLGRITGVANRALDDVVEFLTPEVGVLPDLLKVLADLLLNPTLIPGDPCLASAPLLRDILDLALGQGKRVIEDLFGGVFDTVDDLLLPAFGSVEILTDSVQAILDDPITAALNMILGQRGKIDCEVGGGLGVGFGVIEAGAKILERHVAGLLS